VLLSHDHHFDNLDHAGRRVLATAARVLTTVAGASRLGDNTIGLAPWQSYDLPTRDGRVLRITATPARHGPPDGDRGPVVGFVLAFADQPAPVVYVSGDTVWCDGIAEVSRRFTPGVALLFMGAARAREVGPANLTLTAAEAVTAARAFPEALIVPLHFEGWSHFSESRAEIDGAFAAAGLAIGFAGQSQGTRWSCRPPDALMRTSSGRTPICSTTHARGDTIYSTDPITCPPQPTRTSLHPFDAPLFRRSHACHQAPPPQPPSPLDRRPLDSGSIDPCRRAACRGSGQARGSARPVGVAIGAREVQGPVRCRP
jgi:hypothetical protein